MKRYIYFLSFLAFYSCQQSKFSRDLGCENHSVDNLEIVDDIYNRFSVSIPKNWKINLYYDSTQSSIFSADTTKQLTETYLIDVARLSVPVNFNQDFINRLTKNAKDNNCVVNSSFETEFLKKKAFFTRVIGKKYNYSFEQISFFIQLNSKEHLFAKAEVYGDSLVNERLCEAIYLLEKTKFKND